MTRRILVTGATGFIGRRVVEALRSTESSVAAIVRQKMPVHPWLANTDLVVADLLSADQVRSAVADTAADTLIHCAWDVSPGYWMSASNEAWLTASKELIDAFASKEGRRVILAGTCAEYNWDDCLHPLNEQDGDFRPATVYGQAKLQLRRYAEQWSLAEPGRSYASGLIFFPFGPGEQASRLMPSVIQSCLQGEKPKVSSGRQIRDFIDCWAVGEALAAIALGNVAGPVNIGTGEGRPIGDIVRMVRDRINPDLEIEFGAIPDRPDDPDSLIANTDRLNHEVGYRPALKIDDALERTISEHLKISAHV